MRRLILMRHAKSDWADDDLADHERPLNERGERDARDMGARLKKRNSDPDLVLSSDAKRAQRTAKLVAKTLGVDGDRVRADQALYLASPRTVLAVIATQHDSHPTLLIVAHNPGLTELANQLLPDFDLDNLPTAGVVAIEFDASRWVDLEPVGRLAFYDFPKNAAR